jgi:hypothetical protein
LRHDFPSSGKPEARHSKFAVLKRKPDQVPNPDPL